MSNIHHDIQSLQITKENIQYFAELLKLPYNMYKPIMDQLLSGVLTIDDFIPSKFQTELEALTKTMYVKNSNVNVEYLSPLEIAKKKLNGELIVTINQGNYALSKEIKDRVLDKLYSNGMELLNANERDSLFINNILTAHVLSLDLDQIVLPVHLTHDKSGYELMLMKKELQLTISNLGKSNE